MSLRVALFSAPMPIVAFILSKIFKSKGSQGDVKDSFFPRSLKITKEGGWYIGALLLIGLAAINTGNNLLYLVVAMLLALIIISGILSESTLRGLSVIRMTPRHVHPNKDVSIELVVTNTKKKLPSYSFTIEEVRPSSKKKQGHEAFTSETGYLLKLEPSRKRPCIVKYRFTRRGRAKLTALHIRTRFPFGLFSKGKTLKVPSDIIVYPATRAITDKGPSLAPHAGTVQLSKAGMGVELHGLREYTPGDDSRHIDWKASARTRSVMRKEFQEESERKITLLFRNLHDREEDFEGAVEETASLAKHYLREGYSVALTTLSDNVTHGVGSSQLEKILHTLALITHVKERGAATVELRAD